MCLFIQPPVVLSSPGVKDGSVQEGAIVMVTHKVSAHHRAFAVFGSADGFGDDQVSFVPQVQQMHVEHQGSVWGDHFA